MSEEQNADIRRVSVTMAKTETITAYGQDFSITKKHLIDMAKTATGKQITINFNRELVVGTVVSALVEDDSLIAEVEVDMRRVVRYLNKYHPIFAVPAFSLPSDEKKDGVFCGCGLTQTPLQMGLTPIN